MVRRSGLCQQHFALWVFVLLTRPPLGRTALSFNPDQGKDFNNTGQGYQGIQLDCDLVCQNEQRQALLNFFQATNGERWVSNQGWIEGNVTSHCSWHGVHCCTDDHTIVIKYITIEGWTVTYGNSAESFGQYCPVTRSVAALTLSLNNLSGTLPEDTFSALSDSLQYLDFHGNNITGMLPLSVGSLHVLRELSLNSNSISGPVPSTLGHLHNLIALNLGSNRLTGSLPGSLGELEALKWIFLNDNLISGPVPYFLFGIRSLKTMDLTNNKLSGVITDVRLAFVDIEIPYLLSGYNIEELRLSNNEIEGTIPSTITSLPLSVMDLGGNRLTGTIPPTIARSPFLKILIINNNQFGGTIPDNLSKWNLEELDLSNNQLTGSIPDSLAIKTLKSLNLGNNSITGAIPDAFQIMPRLEYFDIVSNVDMVHKYLNSRGERLPEYLKFDELGIFPQIDSHGQSRRLNCPQPVGNPEVMHTKLKSFRTVVISPEYYGFQQCECVDPEIYSRVEVILDGVLRQLQCTRHEIRPNETPWALILTLAFILGIMVPVSLWTWFKYRITLARVQMNLKKRKGPPGADQEITTVLTDVEGSTELWEWNTEIMAQSIDIHDRIMRSQLSKFYGYEITTEGDAFLVAFHEPLDALAWCISLQYALLGAKWPSELMDHKKAAAENVHTLETTQEWLAKKGKEALYNPDNYSPIVQLEPQVRAALTRLEQVIDDKQKLVSGLRDLGIVFRGLRVRMGVATGLPESMKFHKMTMRAEYFGDVVRRVHAVSDTPHGGQILMDQETFSEVNCRLDELGAMVNEIFLNSRDSLEQKRQKEHGFLHTFFQTQGKVQPRESLCESELLSTIDYPRRRLSSSTYSIAEASTVDAAKGSLVYRNDEGRNQDHSLTMRTSAVPHLRELRNSLSRSASRSASRRTRRRSSLFGAVKVIDMGVHKLKGTSQPNNLVQVAIPGLEERTRFFPGLDSELQISPGYFDAPATKNASLASTKPQMNCSLPAVTLVFCTFEGYLEMQENDKLAAEEALTIYNDCVRRTLSATGGYECQEQEGNYMISFATPDNAVEWCLLVQEVLMEVDWTEDVLRLPGAQEVVNSSGVVVFRGPKVKMGIYEGMPTRALPHSTTGRADYFGQFVNRAARFCHAAAKGGQVITTQEVMARIINGWRHGAREATSDLDRACAPMYCTVVLDKTHAPPRHAYALEEGEFGSSAGGRFPQPVYLGNQRNYGLSDQQDMANKRNPKTLLQDRKLVRKTSFRRGGGRLKRVHSDISGAHIFDPNESSLGSTHSGAGGSFISRSIEEPRYMSSISVTCRIGKEKDRWLWVDTLEVEDLGKYLFKGVTGSHNIVSVKSKRLMGREFEPEIRKGKGEKVELGKGLLFSVKLMDKTAVSLIKAEDEQDLSSVDESSWTAGSEKKDINKVIKVREGM